MEEDTNEDVLTLLLAPSTVGSASAAAGRGRFQSGSKPFKMVTGSKGGWGRKRRLALSPLAHLLRGEVCRH